MKQFLKIFLTITLLLTISAQSIDKDLLNLRFLQVNTTNTTTPTTNFTNIITDLVRCFWLDPNSMSVFDLSNLKASANNIR